MEDDDRIKVNVHKNQPGQSESFEGVWWYSISPLEGYLFIRIPVHVGGVQEAFGTKAGELNADAKYFRYITVPDGRLYGGTIPNNKGGLHGLRVPAV